MSTQLIMTVGTNALPVWVAWYHLKDKLDDDVSMRFICTEGTNTQKELLESLCSTTNILDHIQTDSGDPEVVWSDVAPRIYDDFDVDEGFIHIHYTGGTKVMGVETVSCIEANLRGKYTVEASYLDSRHKDGPRIVSFNGTLIDDARIEVTIDLKDIAKLNGFDVGPFTYTDRIGTTRNCPGSYTPTQNQINEVNQYVPVLFDGCPGSVDRGNLLEFAAYDAFKKALERICKVNTDRCNYQIYNKVYGIRDGVKKPFELDVVAVLGYQVVVVSCDASHPDADRYNRDHENYGGTSYQTSIKRKSMEVYHRAKQIGGDEARAIMLCNCNQNTAEIIEEELADETGSTDIPLQVWGNNTWPHLQQHFSAYLERGLNWV